MHGYAVLEVKQTWWWRISLFLLQSWWSCQEAFLTGSAGCTKNSWHSVARFDVLYCDFEKKLPTTFPLQEWMMWKDCVIKTSPWKWHYMCRLIPKTLTRFCICTSVISQDLRLKIYPCRHTFVHILWNQIHAMCMSSVQFRFPRYWIHRLQSNKCKAKLSTLTTVKPILSCKTRWSGDIHTLRRRVKLLLLTQFRQRSMVLHKYFRDPILLLSMSHHTLNT